MRKSVTNLTKAMAISAIVFTALCAAPAMAQEEKQFNFSATLNSDQFFGFYPTFQGSYGVSDKTALTFYGILWSGGTGSGWGNWTEFGLGLNIEAAEGLNINPQIGILGGNLLSSSAIGQSVIGDGIVPNLTVNWLREVTEGQFYFGYYAPLGERSPVNPNQPPLGTLVFVHYWANFGIRASEMFSIGAHFEHLINSGGSNVEESTDFYQWLGPYIQFTKPGGGPFARFAFGPDLVEGNNSFFKLTAGFSF